MPSRTIKPNPDADLARLGRIADPTAAQLALWHAEAQRDAGIISGKELSLMERLSGSVAGEARTLYNPFTGEVRRVFLPSWAGKRRAGEPTVGGWRAPSAQALYDQATGELLLGNYARGFALYESRWKVPPCKEHARTFHVPRWSGQSLAGKTIYIWHEQGYGDSIMMHRYIPLLEAMAAQVHLEFPPPLVPLFELNTRQEYRSGLPASVDFHCPMMSLPHLLGTTVETVPPPCMAAPIYWGAKIDRDVMNVGLCWAGATHSINDDARSIPLTQILDVLTGIDGVTFWSLTRDKRAGDERLLADYGVAELPHEGFAELAGAIDQMDLVISVDTAVAHLAGSLGIPTLVLLSTEGSWRWMLERATSPWYPSVRILRQKLLQQWGGVLADAAAAVEEIRDRPRTVLTKNCKHGRMSFFANDAFIGRMLREHGEYSDGEVEMLKRCIGPGDTVVCAGANVGALALPLANEVGAAGRVVAYEPQRGVARLLRRNVADNALSQVEVRTAALGAEPGLAASTELDYEQAGNYGAVPILSVKVTGGKPLELLQAARVDTIDALALDRVKLIQADVEGAELDVLLGAAETIRRCRPILYVECDQPDKLAPLLDHLLGLEYRAYWHTPPLAKDGDLAKVVSINLLCVPREHGGIVAGLREARTPEMPPGIVIQKG
jgi:FkbM family methyltransferase